MTTPVLMIDTVGVDAAQVPKGTPKVAVYVTGTGDVPWTAQQIAAAANSGSSIIRIRQNMDNYTPYDAEVLDVEPHACTPQDAARWTSDRYHGKQYNSCVYIDAADAAALAATLSSNGVPKQYIQFFVADWDLNQQGAEAMIGTDVGGYEVVAVQWASPTSNPHTPVPGGNGETLAQANLDLSVTRADWFAHTQPAPKPVPQPANLTAALSINRGGIVVQAPISSNDGGKTWH